MTDFTPTQLIQVLESCEHVSDYSDHHRRSTFFVGHYIEITEELVPEILEEVGIDVSSLIGKRIYGHGTYEEYNGTEYFEVFVQEKTETVVPAWTEIIEHPETVKVSWVDRK